MQITAKVTWWILEHFVQQKYIKKQTVEFGENENKLNVHLFLKRGEKKIFSPPKPDWIQRIVYKIII